MRKSSPCKSDKTRRFCILLIPSECDDKLQLDDHPGKKAMSCMRKQLEFIDYTSIKVCILL